MTRKHASTCACSKWQIIEDIRSDINGYEDQRLDFYIEEDWSKNYALKLCIGNTFEGKSREHNVF